LSILKECACVAKGLEISECQRFGLATVMLRKNANHAAVGAALQVAAPADPTWVASNELTMIGTGPGMWLALTETPSQHWSETLAERLAGVASVSDQSGGYVIFRIAGSSARALLQRGAFIDLTPPAFGAGSVATTVIAHIGVIIWQIDDVPTFHVALFRSFAGSFREWLDTASVNLTF
jgi:heterotetrameric sarcosine oxidase gamma subunit